MRHTITRIPAALAGLTLLLTLVACGGDDDSEAGAAGYCDSVTTFVKDHSDEMKELSPDNTKAIREIADSFDGIADVSSGAVQDDWATLADMYSKVADGKDPNSFSAKETGALQTSVADITTQVKKECDVEF